LSFNHAELGGKVKELMEAGSEWIHCDIMDGQFVPPITFGAEMVGHFKAYGNTPLEAHLMTETPDQHFAAFMKAGCKRIIFHAEATAHAHRLAQTLRREGVQAGIAINPGTSADLVVPMLDFLDVVLVMTVNPGWGGQSFIPQCLEKVRHIRSLNGNVDIEVDGGIDTNTIKLAYAAGANVFVTGSFLAEAESPAKGLEALRQACDTK
jgi:ribulose-phosphate 3-epimerase